MSKYAMPIIKYIGGETTCYELQVDWVAPRGGVVPKGFRFDGMSSPKWAQCFGIGNKSAAQLAAACYHDYAWRKGTTTSMEKANRNFYLNLLAFGVDRCRAKIIYAAVQAFGQSHFEKDE